MITHLDESIFAVASAGGAAARGIIRLSGPRVDRSLDRCFVPDHAGFTLAAIEYPAWVHGRIRVPPPIESVDVDLIYWPTARSYTRQRAAEIHAVGSPPILESIMSALRKSGVRQAVPGEFTMRAFLAGRIDLTRAEAVLGVIDARSERELNIALQQMAGGISQPLEGLRENLLDLLSRIEAALDFVDDDIEFISAEETSTQLSRCLTEVDDIRQQLCSRPFSQRRPRIGLYGMPNVGKSSLLNCLAERPEAIVSTQPGTTRDYVVGTLKLGELQVDVIDTPGVDPDPRTTDSAVTPESQLADVMLRMGQRELSTADLTVLCLDGSRPLMPWELAELANEASNRLVVQTKSDLPAVWRRADVCRSVSVQTGQEIGELRSEIVRRLALLNEESGLVVPSTAQRVLASIDRARDDLKAAVTAAHDRTGDEVIAAQIRSCLDELAAVTGRVYTDDILDRIFSRFCIGK